MTTPTETSLLLSSLRTPPTTPRRPSQHPNPNSKVPISDQQEPGLHITLATPPESTLKSINDHLNLVSSSKSKKSLNSFSATAICGNDILSSSFYVSGLVTLYAGPLAPLSLFLVSLLLYLFKSIYLESVLALPMNGGTYNVLLNCTSKSIASAAAVFGVIAYVATGVVSAVTAVSYLDQVVDTDVFSGSFLLLLFFCGLTNYGIAESASVAKVIFSFHLFTLTALTLMGLLFLTQNVEVLLTNMQQPFPTISTLDATYSNQIKSPQDATITVENEAGSFTSALFYGFSR